MSDENTTPQDDVEVLDAHQPERAVTINLPNSGPTEFTVREFADGDELAEYMNSVAKKMGKGARDFTGMHADLISRCLYDANGVRVPKEMVRRWGAKVQNRLFTICQEINGLTDDADRREGKG